TAFLFAGRRRHTRSKRDWSSDVCSSDLSALANLLDEAADEDIAVVGPKIREWPSLRRLVEVGLAISGTAHRETGLETGEPDDGRSEERRVGRECGERGTASRWR